MNQGQAAAVFEGVYARRLDMIHRFPPGLRALGTRYIEPLFVAIGPYHRHLPRVQEMERMKRVAVHQFMQDTGLDWDALLAAAGVVAAQARALYDIPPAQNQGGDDPAAVQVPEAADQGEPQPHEQGAGQQEQNQDGVGPAAEQALGAGVQEVLAAGHHGIPLPPLPMSNAGFQEMLCIDAFFLLHYISMRDADNVPPSALAHLFYSRRSLIDNDIMLLENQIPFFVLTHLNELHPIFLRPFVAKLATNFHGHKSTRRIPPFQHHGYTPPHLLALLRFCMKEPVPAPPAPDAAGGPQQAPDAGGGPQQAPDVEDGAQAPAPDAGGGAPPALDAAGGPQQAPDVSITFTAIGLEEIGINLNVSDRNRFTDMAIRKRSFGPHLFKDPLLLGRELVLPQLFLGNVSSNYLVNMAAWEVCTAESYVERDTIVCSYIRILAMLMHREDDVHQLRAVHLMEGELTDRETLDLITSLGKHLPMGERYVRMLASIEEYKLVTWFWIAVHKLFYLYFKKIATFFAAIGSLAGVFKAFELVLVKKHQ
ncbi:hypothetical protein D1007_23453 [Hordeum vulgare]|uniref:Uncharacterized protein n=1 Tax=Hordeum vulgare subsp. vulgare TaxID=112509 RepID=A0A8I6WJB4_HORVV|nr:hypothetical protein D1007_23453 [Hordeum vulgare]